MLCFTCTAYSWIFVWVVSTVILTITLPLIQDTPIIFATELRRATGNIACKNPLMELSTLIADSWMPVENY